MLEEGTCKQNLNLLLLKGDIVAAGHVVGAPNWTYPQMMQYVDVDPFGFWKSSGGPTPAGWVPLNDRRIIADYVGRFLYYVNGNLYFGGTIRQLYHSEKYLYASVTKGFHQPERMLSWIENASDDVCHITMRLRKRAWDPTDKDYKTVHLYVNQQGLLWGATLWDERTDQAIS